MNTGKKLRPGIYKAKLFTNNSTFNYQVMNMKTKSFGLLLALIILPAACFGAKLDDVVHSVIHRNEQLQAVFDQFPLLAPATNQENKLVFQTLKLDKPFVIDGINFYGFRIKVPQRTNQEDFVWAFPEPKPRFFWFIIPRTGIMSGFHEFHREPNNAFEDLGQLFPVNSNKLIIQRLLGSQLEDGQEYLIWFAFAQQKPRQISLEFTFANSSTNDAPDHAMMEKALGLRRK